MYATYYLAFAACKSSEHCWHQCIWTGFCCADLDERLEFFVHLVLGDDTARNLASGAIAGLQPQTGLTCAVRSQAWATYRSSLSFRDVQKDTGIL